MSSKHIMKNAGGHLMKTSTNHLRLKGPVPAWTGGDLTISWTGDFLWEFDLTPYWAYVGDLQYMNPGINPKYSPTGDYDPTQRVITVSVNAGIWETISTSAETIPDFMPYAQDPATSDYYLHGTPTVSLYRNGSGSTATWMAEVKFVPWVAPAQFMRALFTGPLFYNTDQKVTSPHRGPFMLTSGTSGNRITALQLTEL